MTTTTYIFQTVAPTLIAVAFVIWKVWTEHCASNERKAIKARQDAQEQVIRGMQDALSQCPFVTYPTPYTDNGKRKS